MLWGVQGAGGCARRGVRKVVTWLLRCVSSSLLTALLHHISGYDNIINPFTIIIATHLTTSIMVYRYGKLLVGETKAAATAILKSLCTNYTPKTPTKPSEKRLAASSAFTSDPGLGTTTRLVGSCALCCVKWMVGRVGCLLVSESSGWTMRSSVLVTTLTLHVRHHLVPDAHLGTCSTASRTFRQC